MKNYKLKNLTKSEMKNINGGQELPWLVKVLGFPAPAVYVAYKYIEGKYEQGAACN